MDAAVYSVAEFIPERLAIGRILRPGGTVAGRVVGGGVAQSIQETVTTAIQMGYDVGILKEDMSWGDAFRRLKDVAIIGGGVGGIVSGAVAKDLGYSVPSESELGTEGVSAISQSRMVIDMDFGNIVSGSRPSDVFKDHIERKFDIDRADLGFEFSDYFPGVNGASHIAIWKWKSRDGIDDDLFNVIIVNFLRDAGYIE